MTEPTVSPTTDPSDLITIARSLVGITISPVNGEISRVATSSPRDYSVRLRGRGGVVALTKGTATVMSGAVVIALPGTKIRANSGSVVIAYRDVEVVAKKGSLVLRVTPYLPPSNA